MFFPITSGDLIFTGREIFGYCHDVTFRPWRNLNILCLSKSLSPRTTTFGIFLTSDRSTILFPAASYFLAASSAILGIVEGIFWPLVCASVWMNRKERFVVECGRKLGNRGNDAAAKKLGLNEGTDVRFIIWKPKGFIPADFIPIYQLELWERWDNTGVGLWAFVRCLGNP